MDTGTRHLGKHLLIWVQVPPLPVQALIPAPNTSVTGTGKYFDTATEYFRKFGITSTPATNTWERSVQHQYRYRTLR